ncbi:hypothetical protein Thermus77923_16090 [Thermus oshimai]
MERTVLVTGAGSGIGLATATLLKARGFTVYAGARKEEDLARLKALGLIPLPLDVTRPEDLSANPLSCQHGSPSSDPADP